MSELSTLEWISASALGVLILIWITALVIAMRLRRVDAQMPAFLERLAREPALVAGLVGVTVALVAAFGLEASAEQTAAVTAFIVGVLAIVTRQVVTPVRALPEPPPEV